MERIEIVDTHVHFWDPEVLDYPWLKEAPALDQKFAIEAFKSASEGLHIESKVFVECNCDSSQNIREVEWIENLAVIDPGIKGIVAYADMNDHTTLDRQLTVLKEHALVKGIRHNIQFNPQGFATTDAFVNGVTKVLNNGFHFELCLTHDQLPECNELVTKLPPKPLMIDHCAKPGIKDGLMDDWKRGMEQLASNDHIYCKVSGLLTEADHSNWTKEEILPYMDHVLAQFGIDRIVYGGDWPVSTLAGGYGAWFELVDEWTSNWKTAQKERFYKRNAEVFYRL